jgi:hypothetical protein
MRGTLLQYFYLFLGLTAYLLPKDVVYVKQQLKKKAESIK